MQKEEYRISAQDVLDLICNEPQQIKKIQKLKRKLFLTLTVSWGCPIMGEVSAIVCFQGSDKLYLCRTQVTFNPQWEGCVTTKRKLIFLLGIFLNESHFRPFLLYVRR